MVWLIRISSSQNLTPIVCTCQILTHSNLCSVQPNSPIRTDVSMTRSQILNANLDGKCLSDFSVFDQNGFIFVQSIFSL